MSPSAAQLTSPRASKDALSATVITWATKTSFSAVAAKRIGEKNTRMANCFKGVHHVCPRPTQTACTSSGLQTHERFPNVLLKWSRRARLRQPLLYSQGPQPHTRTPPVSFRVPSHGDHHGTWSSSPPCAYDCPKAQVHPPPAPHLPPLVTRILSKSVIGGCVFCHLLGGD